MVEETKDKNQVTAPEITPDKAPDKIEETPVEPKYKETPEDVEKSREFHQKQAQEKAEQLKEAEAEIEKIYADLNAKAPTSLESGKEDKPEDEPEPTPAIDDDDKTVSQIVREEMAKVRKEMIEANREALNERDQVYIQREWEEERARAIAGVKAHQKVLNIPDDVFEALDKKASSYVPPINMVGTYTKWANVMRELLSHHQLQGSIAQKAERAKADASAQISHADKALQPGGSAISPPGAGTLEEWNRKQADDIADDDPPVG